MKSKHFLQLIIFFLSAFLCGKTYAALQENEVRVWAQEKGETLLQTFNEKDVAKKYAALDDLFLNYVDLEYIAKFVVGKYWREMTPEQQQEYVPLFQRYALGLYKTFPLNFDTSKIKYDITDIAINGSEAEVAAVVDIGQKIGNAEGAISLVLRLREKNGALKIVDIKLMESSLILSYRGHFYQMIAADDEDISWFLEDLQDLAVSAERNNQLVLQNND